MADRSVTVKLELDIASYLANLKAAEAATRRFGDSAAGDTDRAGTATRKLAGDVDNTSKAMGEAKKSAGDLSSANKKAGDDAESSRKQWDGLGREIEAVGARMRTLMQEFDKTGNKSLLTKIAGDKSELSHLQAIRKELASIGPDAPGGSSVLLRAALMAKEWHGLADEITSTHGRLRGLIQEFNQTGNRSLIDKIAGERSELNRLRSIGTEILAIGNQSDATSKKVASNSLADQHSYNSSRAQVLAITALLTNLPAIVAPALGLLLAVPGAIATGGIAAITAGMAFKGFGASLKALDSNDVTKISAAMNDMSPTMLGFAREVQGVREQWGGLKQSVQGETFTPLLGSMRELTDRVLPMLSDKLPQVGRAIGNVGAGFVSWMGQDATLGHIALLLDNVRNQVEHLVPFIQAWGNAFVNVSNVAGPFLAKLIDMLTALGSRFDAFLTTARATGQLDTLFKTTAVGVQGLLDLISKLADALFTILSSPGTLAAAKVLFGIFNALATVIDVFAHALTALPGPLQAVLLVMLALGGMGPLLAKGFMAAKTALVEVGAGAEKGVAWIRNLGTVSDAAAGEAEKLTEAMKESGKASGGAAKGASGFMAALGGPWALAITAATVGLTILMGAIGDNKIKADEATSAYLQFGQAVANARANGNDSVPELIKQSKAIQDLIIDTDRYGVSSRDMVDSLSGQKDATDRVINSLEAKKAMLYEAAAASGAESEAASGQYQKEIDGINKLEGEFRGIAGARERAAEATALYNKAANQTTGILGDGAARIQAVTALLEVMTSQTASAADINKALGTSIAGIANAAGPTGQTIDALASSIQVFNGVTLTGKDRAGLYKSVITGISDVAAPLSSKVDALGQSFWGAGEAELSAAQRAAVVKQAWEALYKAGIDAANATQDYNMAVVTLQDKFASQTSATHKSAQAIDQHNASIRTANATIATNQAALSANASTVDRYRANIESANATIATHQAALNAGKGSVAGHQAAIDRASAAIAHNQALITGNGATVESHMATINQANVTLGKNQAAIQQASAAAGQNTATLAENSKVGLQNRKMIEDVITSSINMAMMDLANGESLDQVTQKHRNRMESLRRESQALGFAKDDTEALIKTYGNLPDHVETEIRISGVAAVMNQLMTLKTAQLALQMGMEIPAARREIQGQMSNNQFVGHAAGGPVHGPGTGTSDSIAAYGPGGARYRLSDGEHVWTAAEVKAAGGHDVILALRSLVMAGALKPMAAKPGDGSQGVAFARGGPVLSFPPPNWPFPVDTSHTKIPWTLAQIKEKWGFGPGWSGTIPPDVASAQSWIRAQAGKPYLWAEAGPWGYDCSGLVSAVWNILHGRNAYSHTFSTMDEAPYFPKPGWGMFTAGWANAGERGGGDVGHTAGWLAGLPFVSRGGDGVVVGSGAERVDSFAHVGHYDQGGYLQPGWNLAYNGTGRPEPVGHGSGDIHVVLHSDGSNAGRALVALLRPEIQGRFNGDVTRALGTK